ncbi:hypothetical protein RUM44_000722 [Polyplax serrata]|uniref:TAFII55 protein conserved region domain-containing protein n=1 Tax=Polyplax serrata TaxID=468196 RepID=A0ABR1B721_POLSC
MNRAGDGKKEGEAPPELESQFILRLPPEPAKILRELIQSGANNLKDRLSITIENDMRTGEVRLDHMLLHAKVVDFPTILESLKTIDNKTFYKTADVCQMLICKEDDDQTTTDEEVTSKAKKKDPNRVDKKYLYPHGLTPPMKNVRKRRFRKTLKKKYVEAPEIEKEVKRLLRVDNEAVNVKWEVINEEDEKSKVTVKEEPGNTSQVQVKPIKQEPAAKPINQQSVDLAEQEIFGSTVSDSDEEANINIMEIEDTSRLSADDSRLSDTVSQGVSQGNVSNQELVTEFSKDMFNNSRNVKEETSNFDFEDVDYDMKSENFDYKEDEEKNNDSNSKEAIKERLEVLGRELADFKIRRQQQEAEIGNIENMALRQRLQDIIDNLLTEQLQKEHEYDELKRLLEQD